MMMARTHTALGALLIGLGATALPLTGPATAQTVAPEALNVVYGPFAPSREGDVDKLERLYFSLPADASGTHYLRVFDPEYGGDNDTIQGRSNSATQYRFWGGEGAFTATPRPVQVTDGQGALPYDRNAEIAEPGEMLFERVYADDPSEDGQWITFVSFEPSQGEVVGDRVYFRLDVRGINGDDGNVFIADISRSPTAIDQPQGLEITAFDPTMRWPGFGGPVQTLLDAPEDGQVTVQSFDGAMGTIAIQTDYEDLPLRTSGQDDWAVQTVTLADPQVAITLVDGLEKPNDITLSAFDSAGNALPLHMPITRADLIDRPTPVATAQPLSNCVSVAFDGSASSGADELIYRWDFGDGMSSDQPVIAHSYAEPGRYEAMLSILDARSEAPRGNRVRLPVHVRPAPVAMPGDDIVVAPGEAVTFSGASSQPSDAPITRYLWNFGDGNIASGMEVSAAYTTPGIYRAVLRVEDDSAHPCDFGLATREVTVNAAPVAEAGTDQTSVVGATVSFDGSSSYDVDGDVASYRWDMGDGTVLSGAAIDHVFNGSGTFTVTLTTMDDSGVANNTATDTLVVVVNAPPEPAIASLPRPVAVGEVTSLTAAASVDPDGEIITYMWDFGDGAMAEGPDVQYAWTTPGVKTVALTVTDNSGTPSATQSTQMDVIVSAAPTADAGPDQALTASVVRFDGSGSADPDGSIASYQWEFGDGTTATGPQVSHAYRAPGEYEVTLVVRDDSGAPLNQARDTMFVTINAVPLADAGPDIIVTPNQPVALDAGFSVDPDGAISETIWTLPSGDMLAGQAVETVFAEAGLYRIALEVRDDFKGGSASAYDEVVVRVNAPPVAVIGPDLLVEPGVPVTFSGTNSYDLDGTIESYRWDFDDLDEPVFGEVVERTFDASGIVTAQLTIVDSSGALNATDVTDITVRVNHAPVAEAGADVFTDQLFVDFDGTASSDGDGDALIYAWDFGDGSEIVQGRTPRHVFPRSGKFPVTLRIDDGTGLGNATATDALVVTIDAPPIAVAGGNRDVCSGDPILFDASASFDPDGGLLRYSWDFGDGTSSTIVNPNKTYEQPGTYPVTLTVRDESGSPLGIDIDRIATLVREGPIANAGADMRVRTNQNVRFDGSGSTDADGAVNAFNWTFGDGETGSGETPVHAFEEPGTYVVTLTITGDAQGQCSPIDSDQVTVVVEPAPVLAVIGDDIMAAGLENRFDATLEGPDAEGARLTWTFSDGASYEGASVAHTFAEPGEYTVSVEATLTGASAVGGTLTTERKIVVNAQPSAAFEGPEMVAAGDVVSFDASASSDPDGALTAYMWDFGDGNTGTGLTATHVYADDGNYAVSLTVMDEAGVENSSATLMKAIMVNPAPVAGLSNTQALCIGASTSWSSGFGDDVAASWDFGDGMTATGPSVSHAFQAAGLYPVSLILDDGKGLPNSRRVEEIYARVNSAPVAAAGPDRIVDPQVEVIFDAGASGDIDGQITGYTWTFSDGVVAEGPRITRVFDTAGPVDVTLSVTDNSGAAACAVGEDRAAILVNAAPSVDAGPDRTVPVGAAHDVLMFDASGASDPDGQGVTLWWDFGDGASASGAQVTHRYGAPGTYTVTVTARDATGLASGVAMDTATVTAEER